MFGVFGGVFAELLGLFKLRHQAATTLPLWLRSPWYWTMTTLMILSGGGLVIVYVKSQIALTPFLAMNIGASAPLIIGSLVAQAPPIPPCRVD